MGEERGFDVKGVELKDVCVAGGILKKRRDSLLYGLSGVALEGKLRAQWHRNKRRNNFLHCFSCTVVCCGSKFKTRMSLEENCSVFGILRKKMKMKTV